METNSKQCLLGHKYIPNKNRSRPFQCIQFPVWCSVIFLIYWLVVCPLIYVSVDKNCCRKVGHNWPVWWPLVFWLIALLIFLIFMIIAIILWRWNGLREKQKFLFSSRKNSELKDGNVKMLYHVSLTNEKNDENSSGSMEKVDIPLKPVEEEQKIDNTEIDEKSTKRKPNLIIDCNRISTIESNRKSLLETTKSPLTPRELFFVDLIEAANRSPSSHIPATQLFLDNEKGNYSENLSMISNIKTDKGKNECPVEESCVDSEVMDDDMQQELEYFIASVPTSADVTSEVFLYVEGGADKSEFRVTMCDDKDNTILKD